MTKEFRYMMHLLGAGACGFEPPMPEDELDWHRLAELAREQSVEPLVACALHRTPQIPCPGEIRETMIARMFRSGLWYHRRQRLVMDLLGRMEVAGITVVLLKGYSVGRYYASPECRISGDTDVYVLPRDEERAKAFLHEEGFEIAERSETQHHYSCLHPDIGLLELHVRFYDELAEEHWFRAFDKEPFIREEFKKMDSPDGAYYTLGDTDNLIFITLHLVKHFIHSGLSGRQILDVAHFFSVNRKSIDHERFWHAMGELRYDRLMTCVFHMAIRFGDFHREDFPGLGEEDAALTEEILDDLESGGWLGLKVAKSREDGWFEYNRQRIIKSMTAAQYRRYMLKWRCISLGQQFIPRMKRVIEETPGLKGKYWRYPGVLLRWCASYMLRKFFRPIVSEESKLDESSEKRLDMFRKLNMI